jgi:hypothetical protein
MSDTVWCRDDFETHLGTISLNNSIFILPAGVSPILMSMKTTGRVVAVMSNVGGKDGMCGKAGRAYLGSESTTIIFEPDIPCLISFLICLQGGTSTKPLNQRKTELSSSGSAMTGTANA